MCTGFKLNADVLSLLVLRYMRKDGTLRFGDFVACVLHLAAAFGTTLSDPTDVPFNNSGSSSVDDVEHANSAAHNPPSRCV